MQVKHPGRVSVGIPGIFGQEHWTEVLEMPKDDLRLTKAERHYRTLSAHLDRRDYPDEPSYMQAVERLRTAYDQACRELGNPG